GCGGASGPPSKVPDETLRAAVSGLLPALDPHNWTNALGPRTLAPLFDGLTFIQSDGKLRPALANAWAQKEPTVWEFRLRVSDAKFHTGELFTPESVQFTFERLANAQLPLSKLASGVARIDILDPATINIVTREPDANLPRWLSAIYMLPPKYFGQVGERGFVEQPVGTGFWMMDDFQPGSHLHLNVYRDTWRGTRGAMAPPPIKRLELEVMPQAGDRIEALRALNIDVATELTPQEAGSLQATGFAAETDNLGQLNADDAGWQTAAFGAPLSTGQSAFATPANVKGVTALPNGSWWFDRVTKTAMQRVAVAGGA
ncbi:MAG TPA: ABC transporter substrate-binding protein, partial [Chloroflexota bacterium]|nr:ABC transporter substrate-binding protein [Chloroflexota bacterium]